MAEWIEVPAHRILKVTHDEFMRDFERLDADGNVVEDKPEIVRLYRVGLPHFRRKRNGALFQIPKYHKTQLDASMVWFLEEF